MAEKIPVPITLVKSSLGIRESDSIISASVDGDVLYLFTMDEEETRPKVSTLSFSGLSMDGSVNL